MVQRSRAAFFAAILWAVGTTVFGQQATVVGPSPGNAIVVRQQARMLLTREMLSERRTLRAVSLGDYMSMAAPTSRTAPLKYASFATYWRNANMTSQQVGKGFEAVLAYRANRALASSRNKMLLTAAEGFPSHPADLSLVDEFSNPSRLFQAKLRLDVKKAAKVLQTPKYADMTIVTTQESVEAIRADVFAKQASMLARGKPLPQRYQTVADAFADGRLAQNWFGQPLPSEAQVARRSVALKHAEFNRLASASRTGATPEAATLVRSSGGVRRVATLGEQKAAGGVLRSIAAKGVFVLVVAETGYRTYADVQRYRSGEVGGDYLAVKTSIRGAQVSVAASLLSPEPASKLFVILAEIGLVAADIGHDLAYHYVWSKREAATKRMLAYVDRTEKFSAIRQRLISKARASR
jgi:hypothetical protein